MRNIVLIFATLFTFFSACTNQPKPDEPMKFTGAKGEVQLITLDPGHFHAALVQKDMYEQVNPVVNVYAPESDDVTLHLERINKFNARAENPTKWDEKVYTGADFFEKMLAEKKGNVVVLAGNNAKKTEYILKLVQSGYYVLADKPMAITPDDFETLKQAFDEAAKQKVLLYDVMTERFEITTLLQKELLNIPEIFGELQKGTPSDPAVIKESVHHISKIVSGNPVKRPAWFFDVNQQGNGIVDVTTHLVDMVQWACFPEQIIDYQREIEITSARRWSTALNPTQFEGVTGLNSYPDYLKSSVVNDSILNVFANGEINYSIRGVNTKVVVIWNYQAPVGTGDTHYSIIKGSYCNLVIKQGADEKYEPVLYIEPVKPPANFEKILTEKFAALQQKYEGITLVKNSKGWQISVPQEYKVGHEAHFAQVTKKYLQYLVDGLPTWEVPNMIAKYYVTTQGLKKALEQK